MNRLVCGLLLALGAALAHGQDGPRYNDQIIDYTVVAGDTLRRITQSTLGSDTFWEANWRLNPEVSDPDRLRIGQRLRIIAVREVIAERARVEQVVNLAEKRAESDPWATATAGDEVSSGSAVRTRARSTAVLRFNASAVLRLGEYSQVFLSKKETTLAGIDRGSVEITEGDVDVVFEKLSRTGTEIELISGESRVTTAPDAQGHGEIRAGRLDAGATKVMVYTGASTVSAAGQSVNVGSGMGTRVPEKGPPAIPEKLLAAPVLAGPLDWNYSNGIVSWSAVSGARTYVLSMCLDVDCSNLVLRQTGIADARWQLPPQAEGSYYLRVIAVSASGLDGYASKAGALRISDATPDLEAPMIVVRPIGAFHTGPDGQTVAGPDTELEVIAQDERSGLTSLEFCWDTAACSALDGARVRLRTGRLQLQATDALGQRQLLEYRIEPAAK